MTLVLDVPVLDFDLPPERIAPGPIEGTGKRRDQARLLVAWKWDGRLVDTEFADLGRFLDPGDVLVVNTSATLPAAVPTLDGRLVHLSGELPGGLWMVEVRTPCQAGSHPFLTASPGEVVPLPDGGTAQLLAPFPVGHGGPVRLWTAALRLPEPVLAYLDRFGRAIRYGCASEAWPLSAYQTVFASEPGSAEMPSAARAFTPELVSALVRTGIVFAPLTLHTGVSSQETGEPPYPERYRVPAATAELVDAARANGHRVIAVGTTATRAIETVTDERGRVHPGSGWTDLVITGRRGVRAVDGIITGWHEPEASHLQLLEAVAGRKVLERSYRHALQAGYRWHEFGDLHLILP
ncbi:MAG: S-adenosylmethionine:tRNA ribosyltransferase-isomerase [Actinomycetota bacterium]|nr:S-adenosylmethionine:tRNA ribosyltransferase-isomerase [Actinomycetota bacterium]